jgi:hypothetical protein
MPSVEETDALTCLKDDWGTAYDITRQPAHAGPWRAVRRDDSTALEAPTPAGLRAAIRADYHARPVSRDAAS